MPAQSENYPWYGEATSDLPLEQGDFILDCQIVEPVYGIQAKNRRLKINVEEYDVIVLSQSCDLLYNKINFVIVCPFFTLSEICKQFPDYNSRGKKESLRKGNVVSFHLLNKCEIKGEKDFLVVDFKRVYSLPLKYLKKLVASQRKRKRLLPPYREHLAQEFARFFMRVGLPKDIPPFK